METASVGVAVIGASGHAARVVAPTIHDLPGARLAGVLGSSPESGARLAGFYPGARGYAAWDEMAKDPGVQAVWIAGPNYLHAELAARCLDAGKHVFVEKPLTTLSQEAARIASLASERGLVAAVDFQHRFRPGHIWLRRSLFEGVVGTPHLIRIHRFWPYPYFSDMPRHIGGSWRASVEGSGGWALNDIGTHLIDLALWLIGGSAQLIAARTRNYRFRDVHAEDTAVVIAGFDAGATMVIETSNAMSSFPGTVEVHGDDGWIRADGTFDDLGTASVHDGQVHEFHTTSAEVYQAALKDFIARIEGRPAIGATAAEAVATTRIIEQAVALHRDGRSSSSASDQNDR